MLIRTKVLKYLTKITYSLETDEEEGWSDVRFLKTLAKFTYSLETEEEEEIG